MGFDSLDSVGQTVETMADVTNDAEELSTTSRVGDLLNKIWLSRFRLVNDLWTNKLYLINRFHVAGRLSSNRSQMTSKRDKKKNKKVSEEAIAECFTYVFATFWRLVWSVTEQTHGNMESICFI